MADTTLKIYKGDDVYIDVTVKNSDDNAIDITGYKFWFTAKKQEEDTDANAVIQVSTTSHTAPESGQTQLSLPRESTDIDVGTYYYDIQMLDDSDNITTLTVGELVIKQGITNATS